MKLYKLKEDEFRLCITISMECKDEITNNFLDSVLHTIAFVNISKEICLNDISYNEDIPKKYKRRDLYIDDDSYIIKIIFPRLLEDHIVKIKENIDKYIKDHNQKYFNMNDEKVFNIYDELRITNIKLNIFDHKRTMINKYFNL